MANLTGRARSLTISGTLTGKNEIHFGACSGGYAPETSESQSVFSIAIWGMELHGSPVVWGQTSNLCLPPGTAARDTAAKWLDLHITAHLGSAVGDTPSADYTLHTDLVHDYCAGPDIVIDWGGSWSLSVDTVEVAEFSGGGTALGFPNYGGAAAFDPPTENNLRLKEVAKIGGHLTATLTSQGQTLSTSIQITAANQFTIGYSPTINLDTWVYNRTSVNAITAALGSDVCGVSNSYSNANGTVSFGAGVSVTATSGLTATHVSGSAACEPPRSYNLTGKFQALASPYPTSLDMQIDRSSSLRGVAMSGGATFADSGTQRKYTVGAQIGGTSYSDTADEHAAVRLWIRPGLAGDGYANSLLALGEDTTDWRVMLRTYHWAALTITQLSVRTIDATVAPANWTAGAHTTLSGAMTITIDNTGSGSLSSTLPVAPPDLKGSSFSGVSFAGYAFLRLDIIGGTSSSQPARVTIGSKVWDFIAPNTGYTYLDLCSPTNGAGTTDTKDSKWPYATVSPVTVADGPQWGITNVSSILISNLAAGTIYSLSAVQLARKDHAKLWCMAPHTTSTSGWVLRDGGSTTGSVTTTTNVRRFMDGDTDGRRSLELEDYTWVHTDNGSGVISDSFIPASIKSAIGSTAYPHDGFGIIDLKPAPTSGCPDANGDSPYNCWANSDQPMHYLFGGGISFPSSGSFGGLGESVTGTLDSVDWYPGCGDAFAVAGFAYTGAIELRAGKVMRAAAVGIVTDTTTKLRTVGATVTTTAAGISRGTAITGAVGQYDTGLPFVLGGSSATVSQGGNSATGTFPARFRRRFVIGNSPGYCCPFIYQHPFGQLYRVAIAGSPTTGGAVNLWRSDFSTPPWALTAVNASGGTVDADPALTTDHQTDRAFVVFGRSGAAMQIYSDDQGATWSMPVQIIAGGTRPMIATGHDGTIIRAALVGTAIKCTIQRPGDVAASPVATWVDQTGATLSLQNDRFGMAQEHSGGERWIATLMITGDTAPSEWWSADPDLAFTSGAMSWTRL
jgi:hypothetical protein